MAIRIVGVDLPQNKRGAIAVSYTHLDVYKRQSKGLIPGVKKASW